jgi:choline dehydrogenase
VVGGSSAVNTCIALRGQPEDYDEWAALGLREWSWAQCLPAFKRLERDLDRGDDDFHGRDGPLPLRRHPPEEWVAWQAAFVEGCRELGYPSCYDTNAPGSHGVGPHAMNKVEGRRISAAEAYLTPAVRRRETLAIRPGVLVRRVLLRDGAVAGVEVQGPRGVEALHAPQVVLCAGAIHTPALLLRSGLGPRADVERIGVELLRDLPAIGRRLLDHPGTAFFLRPRWFGPTRRLDPLIQTVLRYPSGARAHPSDMMIQPGSSLPLPRVDLPLVSIMAQVGKPRGSGMLRVRTADPHQLPVIESRLLSDAGDRALAVDAMQRAYAVVQTAPMRALASHFWPRERVLRDRALAHEWIVNACDSGYHPCGTVPMGAESAPDIDAATDERGHVRGVQGLTVADASLMPTIPSTNIHLATLMIGERIGAWLRDEG